MKDINNFVCSGNLVRDPEQKQAGEYTVTSFTIANNINKEKVNFLECSVFGKYGDTANKFLKKGMKVTVTGSIEIQTWDGKDGSKKNKTVVKVSEFFMHPQSKEKIDDSMNEVF